MKQKNIQEDMNNRELIDYVTNRFFIQQDIMQIGADGRSFNIHRSSDTEISTTPQPNHDGKILLATYYQEKYGVEIFNIANIEDSRNLFHFLSSHHANYKIGILLPAALDGQTNGLETYDTIKSSQSHCYPIIIERSSPSDLTIIDLDCIARKGINFSTLIDKTNPTRLFTTRSDSIMDTNSCHSYAMAILKDALRIDNLAQQIESTPNAINFEVPNTPMKICSYEKLPPCLLKTAQSPGYVGLEKEGENKDTQPPDFVIRSRPDKDNITLDDHRSTHCEPVTCKMPHEHKEGRKIKSSFLWEKANKNPQRLVNLLQQHHLSTAEEIESFVEGLKNAKSAFFTSTKRPDSVLSQARVKQPEQQDVQTLDI